jgi:hypothetical protein
VFPEKDISADQRRNLFLQQRLEAQRNRERYKAAAFTSHLFEDTVAPEDTADRPPSRGATPVKTPPAETQTPEPASSPTEKPPPDDKEKAKPKDAKEPTETKEVKEVKKEVKEAKEPRSQPGSESDSSEESVKRMKRPPSADFGTIQRQLREEARANRERQMAALKESANKLDMDRIVAQAEREQRKQLTLKRSKNLPFTPVADAPDMDQLVAQAEAELKKKRRGDVAPPAPSDKEEGMQQASAILEALNMPSEDPAPPAEAPQIDPDAGSFYLAGGELKLPAADDTESSMQRAERIRAFLEKQLGFDRFMSLYQTISNAEAKPDDVDKETSSLEPGFIVLLHQLHVLDDTVNKN